MAFSFLPKEPPAPLQKEKKLIFGVTEHNHYSYSRDNANMKINKNLQETKLKIFPTGTHNEFHIILIYYIAGNFGETFNLAIWRIFVKGGGQMRQSQN